MPLATPADDVTDRTDCDFSRRFVRVLGRRDNGLIEFSFAIGWPDLSVDLMLPAAAFDTFCASHGLRAQEIINANHPMDGDKRP